MSKVTSTELVWAGKYDDEGNLRPIERTILPFQVVESVNESKADREKAQRDLFTLMPRDDTWRNILIWGDNKVVMSSLLPRFAGKIKLIYIDPPFATGQDFSFRVRVGDEDVEKLPSIIEAKAYRDMWGEDKIKGIDQLSKYLAYMYERLVLIRELLSEEGSIFIHIGTNVNHTLRMLTDEVFGLENFRNEIVVKRGAKSVQAQFATIDSLMYGYDTILLYSRNKDKRLPHLRRKLKDVRPGTWNNHWRGTDRPTMRYELFGIVPKSGQWRWSKERTYRAVRNYERYLYEYSKQTTIDEYYLSVLDETGEKLDFVRLSQTGKPEHYVPPTATQLLNDVWLDISAYEKADFPTQKSEELLIRIVDWLSNEDDLVADFFCGSGTTLSVAEKLSRRWIGCDLSKWAIQKTRKRLLQVKGCRPFDIMNLGNYERHKLAVNDHWERYIRFILDLYRAEAITGFETLHGKKARAYIHVGSVDSPITMREIRQTLKEAQETGAREVHFLGWDFEMGLHDLVNQVGEDHSVKVRLVSIPRESLEVTNPAREEVRFFDLNYLELEHEVKGKKVTVQLKEFIIANPEYLPDEVRAKIKKFSDYIDYWAVDWDYYDDTFHNGWQSFRTRKDPKLVTKAAHTYDRAGTYKVLVKVVDIFGNDTTKMVEVKVQ